MTYDRRSTADPLIYYNYVSGFYPDADECPPEHWDRPTPQWAINRHRKRNAKSQFIETKRQQLELKRRRG